MIKLICLFVFVAFPCAAQTLYVSPSGADSGPCSQLQPCATLQHAADVVGQFTLAVINLAHGSYSAGLNVSGYRRVAVIGDVANPSAVVINISDGNAAFWSQDGATLGVSGLTINAPHGIGLATRQFAVADYADIRWGPASIHLAANEQSKINCLKGSQIVGSATYHALAGDHSSISMTCDIAIAPGVSMFAFLWDGQTSLILINGARFTGSVAAGAQWIITNAELAVGPTVVPGNPGGNIQRNAVID